MPTLDQLLHAAGAAWDRPDDARRLLDQALAAYPDDEAAYIAAYRFHFYRNEFAAALAIAERCLSRVLAELALPADWRSLVASDVDFTDLSLPRHRFLLFALNAYAYLLARLGRLDEADTAFAVVASLDPADRIGAARLRSVLQRGANDTEAD